LAVDFGTSNTAAVLRRNGGRAEPVLVDGSPLLASAVFVQSDRTLLIGRDAILSARLAPERFEPNPKLRVDDGVVLLGVEVPVADLFAAVLDRVAKEARRVAREPLGRLVGSVELDPGRHRAPCPGQVSSSAMAAAMGRPVVPAARPTGRWG
jgi:molecular chaperone DnaK (HSP70)